MDLDPVNQTIAAFHRGRKWILVPDVAAAATETVRQLRESGSGPIMIVTPVEGVGDLPAADVIRYTRASGDTQMNGIRAALQAIEQPSADVLAAVDEFDPDREAMVLGAGFSRSSVLAGRPVYGARPATWGALEDKMIVDQLWDDAGVRRAPSAVVPVADAPPMAAGLASDLGTVWVADNTEGWHGGAEYARWVRDPEDVAPAVEWFTKRAVEVRVMPFLDGIPCSIHGFATHDGVSVFLPVEMVILRRVDRPEFVYVSAANFWNPPAAVRDEMRAAARRVGTLLNERYGYLGGFGIDGVCTSDGFLPTELNPRLSKGHQLQALAADLPLDAMELMHIEGDLEISAAELEEFVLRSALDSRRGGMLLPLDGHEEPRKVGIRFIDERAVAVDPDGIKDATAEIGPAVAGSIIIMRLEADRTPIGPPIAPRSVAAIDLVREIWDLDIPKVAAAPDRCG
ncbi:MAG: hypothetical protein WBP49_15210 [Acidimicrobiia bacterium]